jgi:hypothetical protein
MEQDDYQGQKIIKNAWPEWVPVDEGEVVRHWRIEFEREQDQTAIALSECLGEPELVVTVKQGATPTELHVMASTRGNPWSDELFFFAFYRLFERLESRFGRIRTIQGQSRNQWRPFR